MAIDFSPAKGQKSYFVFFFSFGWVLILACFSLEFDLVQGNSSWSDGLWLHLSEQWSELDVPFGSAGCPLEFVEFWSMLQSLVPGPTGKL